MIISDVNRIPRFRFCSSADTLANMKITPRFISVLLTATLFIRAGAQEDPPELVTLKAHRASAQENATSRTRIDYIRDLEVMLRTAKDSGDLDASLSIENELKMAKATGGTATGGADGSELATRRTRYQKDIQEILTPIQARFVEELEKLQALYTKRGQLESALEIREELNAAKSLSSSSPPKSQVLLRPKDSVEHRGKYYKIFNTFLSWPEARDKCVELGGQLATVKNADENEFILALASRASSDSFWLGATDEASEGNWVWVDGTPVTFTNWAPEQPSNHDQAEHYLYLLIRHERDWVKQEMKWGDLPSAPDGPKPGFICEWK